MSQAMKNLYVYEVVDLMFQACRASAKQRNPEMEKLLDKTWLDCHEVFDTLDGDQLSQLWRILTVIRAWQLSVDGKLTPLPVEDSEARLLSGRKLTRTKEST